MIFPRCLILEAAETEFKRLPLENFRATLQTKAPIDKYIMIDIGQGWLIINSFFFNSIHFQLSKSEAYIKNIEPIIKNPDHIAWYQEKQIVLFGLPIVFSAGFILGFLSLR
jgi:hypothetical protein